MGPGENKPIEKTPRRGGGGAGAGNAELVGGRGGFDEPVKRPPGGAPGDSGGEAKGGRSGPPAFQGFSGGLHQTQGFSLSKGSCSSCEKFRAVRAVAPLSTQ